MASPKLIVVGEFGRAVGLKGDVRLKSFTAEPEAIADYNPLLAADGREIVIERVRAAPGTADMLVARVKGVTNRDAAEALNRVTVSVPRERLPEPEDDDEYLQADLVGLSVRGPDGATLGEVVSVANYGGGDLLEVRPLKGPTALVPFRDPFVPVVDIAGGFVVLSEPGLLDPPTPPAARRRVP